MKRQSRFNKEARFIMARMTNIEQQIERNEGKAKSQESDLETRRFSDAFTDGWILSLRRSLNNLYEKLGEIDKLAAKSRYESSLKRSGLWVMDYFRDIALKNDIRFIIPKEFKGDKLLDATICLSPHQLNKDRHLTISMSKARSLNPSSPETPKAVKLSDFYQNLDFHIDPDVFAKMGEATKQALIDMSECPPLFTNPEAEKQMTDKDIYPLNQLNQSDNVDHVLKAVTDKPLPSFGNNISVSATFDAKVRVSEDGVLEEKIRNINDLLVLKMKPTARLLRKPPSLKGPMPYAEAWKEAFKFFPVFQFWDSKELSTPTPENEALVARSIEIVNEKLKDEGTTYEALKQEYDTDRSSLMLSFAMMQAITEAERAKNPSAYPVVDSMSEFELEMVKLHGPDSVTKDTSLIREEDNKDSDKPTFSGVLVSTIPPDHPGASTPPESLMSQESIEKRMDLKTFEQLWDTLKATETVSSKLNKVSEVTKPGFVFDLDVSSSYMYQAPPDDYVELLDFGFRSNSIVMKFEQNGKAYSPYRTKAQVKQMQKMISNFWRDSLGKSKDEKLALKKEFEKHAVSVAIAAMNRYKAAKRRKARQQRK